MSINIDLSTASFPNLRSTPSSCYVDKTGYLEQFLLRSSKHVNLFTRPRRFGKTMAMSMIADFLDIARDSRENFSGLHISKNEELCAQWMNKFPVVFLSLASVAGDTFDKSIESMKDVISSCLKRHKEIFYSDHVDVFDRKLIHQLREKDCSETSLEKSLLLLSDALYHHYNKRVIIIIDEYDMPVDKANECGFYDKMIRFMTNFLSSAFKDNEYLKCGIITGCLRVTKASIFSGLNNVRCYGIQDTEYDGMFGFTSDEVDRLLDDTGFSDKKQIIREWYDGYHFGSRQDIYCPWSILNYIHDLQKYPEKQPQSYWLDVSENRLTKGFADKIISGKLPQHNLRDADRSLSTFRSIPDDIREKITYLLSGKTVSIALSESLNYPNLYDSPENFWTLMYMSGYLTTSTDVANCANFHGTQGTLLAIPNKEVHTFFESEVVSWFSGIIPDTDLYRFFDAFWNADAKAVDGMISNILMLSESYHDHREYFYHALLFGIFSLTYRGVSSNREEGLGRFDLMVPDRPNSRAAVVEVKRASSAADLHRCAYEGMMQIAEKKYDYKLRQEGYHTVLRWSMAFGQKTCRTMVQRIVRDGSPSRENAENVTTQNPAEQDPRI